TRPPRPPPSSTSRARKRPPKSTRTSPSRPGGSTRTPSTSWSNPRPRPTRTARSPTEQGLPIREPPATAGGSRLLNPGGGQGTYPRFPPAGFDAFHDHSPAPRHGPPPRGVSRLSPAGPQG